MAAQCPVSSLAILLYMLYCLHSSLFFIDDSWDVLEFLAKNFNQNRVATECPVVRFKLCTAACLWAVSHWGENVRGWRVNCKHQRYSEVPPCSRSRCENAERRGGDTLSSAIWDLSHRDMRYEIFWCVRLCSLQIFLKWCAAEQHWDKVCNFGKYFELWKDKTILQYYLYHSYNCTMSSNNTSAVKSTSHHL